MTQLLEKALSEVAKLNESEQNALASILLEEIASDGGEAVGSLLTWKSPPALGLRCRAQRPRKGRRVGALQIGLSGSHPSPPRGVRRRR